MSQTSSSLYILKYFLLICLSCTFFQPLEASKKGSRPIKSIGDIGQVALPVLALGMTLVYQDGRGAIEFTKSFGMTMGVTYLLKPLVNEDRPISSSNRRRGGSGGKMSFPSGHTAAAFGAAAFLQMRYGWVYGIPCYLTAGYVGFSRIYGQKHWFMDVLGATAIALSANILFTTPYPKWRCTVEPILKDDYYGVSLHWEM